MIKVRGQWVNVHDYLADPTTHYFESQPEQQRKYAAESVHSNQGYDLAILCQRNMYTLFVCHQKADGTIFETKIGLIFVVKGRKALINGHYFVDIELKDQEHRGYVKKWFEVHPPGAQGGYEVSETELYDGRMKLRRGVVSSEMELLTLPLRVPAGKNLLKHICREKDVEKLEGGLPVMMGTWSKVGDNICPTLRSGTFIEIGAVSLNHNGVTKQFEMTGITNIDSIPGDCGSAYIACDDTIKNKIIGFHIGGRNGQKGGGSCFSVLCKEDLDPYCKTEYFDAESDLFNSETRDDQFPLKGSFKLLGEVKKDMVPNTALNTKLRESEIFGKVQTATTMPAQLRPALTPDGPMIKGAQKYGQTTLALDEVLVAEAVKSYEDMLLRLPFLESDKKLLRWEEACAGKEGDNAYPPIQRTKSPGYPWMMKPKMEGKGKQPWLGKDEWVISEELLEACKRLETEPDRKSVV